MNDTEKAPLKSRIRAILSDTPGLDALDLAERLEISLKDASDLCNELIAEGKIKADKWIEGSPTK